MLTRQKKEAMIADLKEDFTKADAVFLTNLIGLSANDAVEMRKKVREANGKLVVTRNTLFKIAAQGSSAESLVSDLKGPNAVAFAFEDAAAVAKAIYDTQADHEEIVTIGNGFLGEKALSPQEVTQLAKLPSRDQMLATLLATFNAPISAFARVLHAIKEQKEENGGESPAVEAAAAEAPAEEVKAEETAADSSSEEAKPEETKTEE